MTAILICIFIIVVVLAAALLLAWLAWLLVRRYRDRLERDLMELIMEMAVYAAEDVGRDYAHLTGNKMPSSEKRKVAIARVESLRPRGIYIPWWGGMLDIVAPQVKAIYPDTEQDTVRETCEA